jgi:Mlc titration factor MtfA (ptsG expression regulator)
MSFQIGKYCRSKKPQSAARRQEILENRRRENSNRSEAIQAIIKAMEAIDEFSNWKGHQHIAHRNNHRFLFESGAMKPLVEFLAQIEVPLGSLQDLNRGTGNPIDTLKSWCKNLRRDLQTVPYPESANVRKRALTKEQEDRIVQRIQSDFINQKKFCPP